MKLLAKLMTVWNDDTSRITGCCSQYSSLDPYSHLYTAAVSYDPNAKKSLIQRKQSHSVLTIAVSRCGRGADQGKLAFTRQSSYDTFKTNKTPMQQLTCCLQYFSTLLCALPTSMPVNYIIWSNTHSSQLTTKTSEDCDFTSQTLHHNFASQTLLLIYWSTEILRSASYGI